MSNEAGYQARVRILSLLKSCTASRNLAKGKQLHLEATSTGDDANVYVATSLINMYSKCGCMAEARQVFNNMSYRNVVTWNSLLMGYAENGQMHTSLELYEFMQRNGCSPDGRTHLAALKACGGMAGKETGSIEKQRLADKGKEIHLLARSTRCMDIYVASALVSLFGRCGRLEEASMVFNGMPSHNLVSWNTMMVGYNENGEPRLALELFEHMHHVRKASPDSVTLAAALKACSDLIGERKVDGQALEGELVERTSAVVRETKFWSNDSELFLASALVICHSKLGDIFSTEKAFRRIKLPDVVLWNALLVSYVENSQPSKTLQLYGEMSCRPDRSTFVAVLKACATLASAEESDRRELTGRCRALHSQLSSFGYESDMFVASTLLGCYGKLGCMAEAREVFDKMPCKDVVSWTSLILGYAEGGEEELALELFTVMKRTSEPDALTYVAVFKACTGLAAREESKLVDGILLKPETLQRGVTLHKEAASRQVDGVTSLANTLLDFYANCGDMIRARRVFDCMSSRTVVSWTALILGYTENGNWQLALELFTLMQKTNISPNARTFVAALKACASGVSSSNSEVLDKGVSIYNQAVNSGFQSNMYLSNTLLDLYVKSGQTEDARRAFEGMRQKDTVSWTVLLLGYVEVHQYEQVLELFARMNVEFRSGVDSLVYVAALKACSGLACREPEANQAAKLRWLEQGMSIHSQASEYVQRDIMLMNTLLDMYINCGSILDARTIFDRMPVHTVVTWNTLLTGYVDHAEEELALKLLLSCMESTGCVPDARTLTAGLKACTGLLALEEGRKIHGRVCRRGFESDPVLETCLVELYGRCGSMHGARYVLDSRTDSRECLSWAALAEGYSRQGDTEKSFECLERMEELGLQPDGTMFLSLLAACSHAGKVSEGMKVLERMTSRYGVEPGAEHYSCMVDLLGRANELDKAVEVAERMPPECASVAWSTVLGACSKWKNVEVGKVAFEKLMEVDSKDGASYVLMASLYL